MRIRPFGVFLASLFILAGCSQQKMIMGGEDRRQAGKPTMQRMVSLSPSGTEILAMRVPTLFLLGRTASCNFPDIVKNAPVIMNGVKPNFEAIREKGAEFIIYDKDLYSEADIAQINQLGLRTFAIEGDTVEEFIKCLYRLGQETGYEIQMMDYIKDIRSSLEVAKAPIEPKPKVAIILPGEGGEHMIAGVDSFQADVVKQCAATPVGPKARNFVTLNAEEFVAMNPDVIICGNSSLPIFNDSRFSSINAIKNKSLAALPTDVIVRRGCRVELFIKNVDRIIKKGVQGS